MGAQTVLGIIGAVLGITGVLGVAYAVFRSATVQKTLDLYETENAALGKAVARQQVDLVAVTSRLEQIERENEVLRNVVTGKAQLDEIGAATRLAQQQHEAMMGVLGDVVRLLEHR